MLNPGRGSRALLSGSAFARGKPLPPATDATPPVELRLPAVAGSAEAPVPGKPVPSLFTN